MRHSIRLLAALFLASPLAVGQNLEVPAGSAERAAQAVPLPGSSMAAVEASLGAPTNRHGPVGDPPITRWDYPGLAVFFEYDKVLHSVVIQGGR
ncbi:MAG: hypothetical protein ACO3IZ_12255 [Steroidobacteraceae bacterium]